MSHTKAMTQLVGWLWKRSSRVKDTSMSDEEGDWKRNWYELTDNNLLTAYDSPGGLVCGKLSLSSSRIWVTEMKIPMKSHTFAICMGTQDGTIQRYVFHAENSREYQEWFSILTQKFSSQTSSVTSREELFYTVVLRHEPPPVGIGISLLTSAASGLLQVEHVDSEVYVESISENAASRIDGGDELVAVNGVEVTSQPPSKVLLQLEEPQLPLYEFVELVFRRVSITPPLFSSTENTLEQETDSPNTTSDSPKPTHENSPPDDDTEYHIDHLAIDSRHHSPIQEDISNSASTVINLTGNDGEVYRLELFPHSDPHQTVKHFLSSNCLPKELLPLIEHKAKEATRSLRDISSPYQFSGPMEESVNLPNVFNKKPSRYDLAAYNTPITPFSPTASSKNQTNLNGSNSYSGDNSEMYYSLKHDSEEESHEDEEEAYSRLRKHSFDGTHNDSRPRIAVRSLSWSDHPVQSLLKQQSMTSDDSNSAPAKDIFTRLYNDGKRYQAKKHAMHTEQQNDRDRLVESTSHRVKLRKEPLESYRTSNSPVRKRVTLSQSDEMFRNHQIWQNARDQQIRRLQQEKDAKEMSTFTGRPHLNTHVSMQMPSSRDSQRLFHELHADHAFYSSRREQAKQQAEAEILNGLTFQPTILENSRRLSKRRDARMEKEIELFVANEAAAEAEAEAEAALDTAVMTAENLDDWLETYRTMESSRLRSTMPHPYLTEEREVQDPVNDDENKDDLVIDLKHLSENGLAYGQEMQLPENLGEGDGEHQERDSEPLDLESIRRLLNEPPSSQSVESDVNENTTEQHNSVVNTPLATREAERWRQYLLSKSPSALRLSTTDTNEPLSNTQNNLTRSRSFHTIPTATETAPCERVRSNSDASLPKRGRSMTRSTNRQDSSVAPPSSQSGLTRSLSVDRLAYTSTASSRGRSRERGASPVATPIRSSSTSRTNSRTSSPAPLRSSSPRSLRSSSSGVFTATGGMSAFTNYSTGTSFLERRNLIDEWKQTAGAIVKSTVRSSPVEASSNLLFAPDIGVNASYPVESDRKAFFQRLHSHVPPPPKESTFDHLHKNHHIVGNQKITPDAVKRLTERLGDAQLKKERAVAEIKNRLYQKSREQAERSNVNPKSAKSVQERQHQALSELFDVLRTSSKSNSPEEPSTNDDDQSESSESFLDTKSLDTNCLSNSLLARAMSCALNAAPQQHLSRNAFILHVKNMMSRGALPPIGYLLIPNTLQCRGRVTAEALKTEKADLTFQPKIVAEMTNRLTSHRRGRTIDEVGACLYANASERETRREERLAEARRRIEKECTFRPQLISQYMRDSSVGRVERSRSKSAARRRNDEFANLEADLAINGEYVR